MATDKKPDELSLSFVEQFESIDESRKKDAVIRRISEEIASWLKCLHGQGWLGVDMGELPQAAVDAIQKCMDVGAIEARFEAEVFINPMGERWQIEVRATGQRWRQRVASEVERMWADGAKVQPNSIYLLRLTEYGSELHSEIQSRQGDLWLIVARAMSHLIEPDVDITDKGAKQPAGHNGPTAVAAAQSTASVVVNFHDGPQPDASASEKGTDDAYVPMSELWQDHFDTAAQCTKFLNKTTEIHWRKPAPNRRDIHIGDWHRYWKDLDRKAFELLDSDATKGKIADIEARKADATQRKRRGK
jgi:hypothetical protein